MFLLSLAFALIATTQPVQDLSSLAPSKTPLEETEEELALLDDPELETQEIVFDDFFDEPFDLEIDEE